MKKLVLSVFSILSSLHLLGQTFRPNEVGISYGLYSNSQLYTLVSNVFGSVLYKDYHSSATGAIVAEYYRDLGELISVGGAFAYFNLSTTENEKQNSYNNFSLIPAVKFHWYRRAWFGSYSKLGAGLTFLPWREGKDRFQFNFQVSFLGLEAGPEFLRAFAEVGVGEQGIVVAGLRYRF